MDNLIKTIEDKLYDLKYFKATFSKERDTLQYQEQHNSSGERACSFYDIIEHYNSIFQYKKFALTILFFIFFTVSIFSKLFIFETSGIFVTMLGICTFVSFGINYFQKYNSSIYINYKLPKRYSDFIEKFNSKLSNLLDADKLWEITHKNKNTNYKHNCGSKLIYKRKRLKITKSTPPLLKCNLDIYSLVFEKNRLYFFPDFILLQYAGKYFVINYNYMLLDYLETEYYETKELPFDAKKLGSKWLYLNKNGKPDKRFKKNREIPKVVYSEISFSILNFLKLDIQVSNMKLALEFATFLGEYVAGFQKKLFFKQKAATPFSSGSDTFKNYSRENYYYKNMFSGSGKKAPKKYNDYNQQAFQTLNLNCNANLTEIKSAYRKLMKLYHPDLYANKSKKYLQQAEKKVKEINAAYNQLIN